MKNKLTLIVVIMFLVCFTISQIAIAGGRERLPTDPIWGITEGKSAKSVFWKPYKHNRRFAIWDAGTKSDNTDDLVLDRETQLVWERNPVTTYMDWYESQNFCLRMSKANRFGFRLPAIEELASLLDPSSEGALALPDGHPFIDIESMWYVSATTVPNDGSSCYGVNFSTTPPYGNVTAKWKDVQGITWCVRGQIGHDSAGYE